MPGNQASQSGCRQCRENGQHSSRIWQPRIDRRRRRTIKWNTSAIVDRRINARIEGRRRSIHRPRSTIVRRRNAVQSHPASIVIRCGIISRILLRIAATAATPFDSIAATRNRERCAKDKRRCTT
jgi:hypothetical protein